MISLFEFFLHGLIHMSLNCILCRIWRYMRIEDSCFLLVRQKILQILLSGNILLQVPVAPVFPLLLGPMDQHLHHRFSTHGQSVLTTLWQWSFLKHSSRKRSKEELFAMEMYNPKLNSCLPPKFSFIAQRKCHQW